MTATSANGVLRRGSGGAGTTRGSDMRKASDFPGGLGRGPTMNGYTERMGRGPVGSRYRRGEVCRSSLTSRPGPTRRGSPGERLSLRFPTGRSQESMGQTWCALGHGIASSAYISTPGPGVRSPEGPRMGMVRASRVREIHHPQDRRRGLSEPSSSAYWVPPLSPLVSSSSVTRVPKLLSGSARRTRVRVSRARSLWSDSGSSATERLGLPPRPPLGVALAPEKEERRREGPFVPSPPPSFFLPNHPKWTRFFST